MSVMVIIMALTGCRDNSGLDEDGLSGDHPTKLDQPLYERFSSRIISLNGTWKVAGGNLQEIPKSFDHSVEVPGLISQAQPPFSGVGLADSQNKAFWYRTTFQLERNTAPNVFLKIYKAKYGTGVYVNGKSVGENMLNFTPTRLNITPYLNDEGPDNELIVRVGAHIESLPDTVVTGGEVEKFRYIPGIYDEVELILSEHIYFSSVQVATHDRTVEVEAEITNNGPSNAVLWQANIRKFQDQEIIATREEESMVFNIDETRVLRFSIPVEEPLYWTPETPHLYVLEVKAGNETYTTRFGFRNFKLDSAFSNRAYLNDQPYYFRGTNLAIFRFFEDPLCNYQPWDRQWVRELFRKFKSLGMNSARTTICSFPKFWYEIADEEGFALFAEYPIWYALKEGVSAANFEKERLDPQRRYGIYPEKLTTERLAYEYSQWMRDLWNHASVIAWDAQNETWSQATGEAICKVRHLDLSNRPWDNGWSPPVSASDFREAHPYFTGFNKTKTSSEEDIRPFRLSDLAEKEKIPGTFYSPYQRAYGLPLNPWINQPCLINEYGYLWLNRDGTPTTLTQPYYDEVLGPEAKAEERREHYAYMLAAITEYWRSVRTTFGILHVFGLAHSLTEGATSDNFVDINRLEFDEHFEEYSRHAFNPLGVCIESWYIDLAPGHVTDVPIVITNDENKVREGTVLLTLERNGEYIEENRRHFKVDPFVQTRLWMRVTFPDKEGEYRLIAIAESENDKIRSLRKIKL